MEHPRPPMALLRGAATILPRRVLTRLSDAVVRGLDRNHPSLLRNVAGLAPALIYIAPTDLPYGFALRVGCEPVRLSIVDARPANADADVRASTSVLIDLLEGRIDSDTLFFRRDLMILGNTAVIVGLRNVLDREELNLATELGTLCGPLRPAARRAAIAVDRLLERMGSRVAAVHRRLHPQNENGTDIAADLDRCRTEIRALTARLAALEARQKRREEKGA